jgi:uncharacterized protein (DUF885 family)
MYTDAIWRACRIILDVKLQRGEIGVGEAIDFLVEKTGFERPNAVAEVHWYTYRPTYPMSYLLGKALLLRLRDDEKGASRRQVLTAQVPRHHAQRGQRADQRPPPHPCRVSGVGISFRCS